MTDWKLPLVLLVGITVGAGGVYIRDRQAYPVVGQTCWKQSGECTVTTRYSDWQSCQWAVELGNMGCDRTDAGNVICKPAPNAVVFGQCVNR